MSDDITPEAPEVESARALHVQPVTNDTAPQIVTTAHAEELRASGLTDDTIRASEIRSVNAEEISRVLSRPWRRGGGFVIPFRGFEHGRSIGERVKPDNPRVATRTNGRARVIKYDQRMGSPSLPYFGPKSIEDSRYATDAVRVWTEGEKKTLLIDQLGFAAIGLTGVFNFHNKEKLDNGEGLHWSPALLRFAEKHIKGRDHVIAYDADAWENDQVMLALRRLAGLLLASGANSVNALCIPLEEHATNRKIGIDDYFVANGEAKTRALFGALKTVREDGDVIPLPPKDPLVKLKTVRGLRNADLPGNLRLPPHFSVDSNRSVWFTPPGEDAEPKEMMASALIPTRLLRDATGDEQRVQVTYYARGDWHLETMDRRAMRDARRLLAEAPSDALISSGDNQNAVQWLREFWRHNEARIPTLQYAQNSGWNEIEGEDFFACGSAIVRDKSKLRVDVDRTGDRRDLIKALTPRGTVAEHEAALRRAFVSSPTAAIAILGSLGAPLLRPLGAPNFAIHFPGESSRGKTTRVRIAASVYGNPSNAQWFGSWNTTSNAIEFRAQGLCDLPLCFDEVGAGDARQIETSIYSLVNGQGRSRGDKTLKARRTATWRTVVLSTGEKELATEQASTGAQIRVIQLRVTGFEGMEAKEIDEMREACERNSGCVGEDWLGAIVDVEDWSPFASTFEKFKEDFRSIAVGPVSQRQAAYFAFLATVETIAAQTIGIGDSNAATVRKVFSEITEEHEIEVSGVRAQHDVVAWITSHSKSFPRLRIGATGDLSVPNADRINEVFGVLHKDRVWFNPLSLRRFLEEHGHSPREVLSQWREIGALDSKRAGKFGSRIKYDGLRRTMVSVLVSSIGFDGESQTEINEFADD